MVATPVLADRAAMQYLTTAEVALRYRTTPSTVRYWRSIGYGPAGIKRGRRVLYDPAALDRWDAEQEQGDSAA